MRRSCDWRETLPRAACDYAFVQVSAVISLAFTAWLQVEQGASASFASALQGLRAYYTDTFLPLSVVFPIVFGATGFYSFPRTFLPEYKWRLVTRGAIAASLIYLFASFLVTRDGTLPRSALLLLPGLVLTSTLGSRWLRSLYSKAPSESPFRPPERTILVVGGAGYIGALLVRRLLAAGARVRILDSLVYGDRAIRDVISHPNCEFIAGDCRNIQSVVSAVRGVHSLVHLAAIVGDPACEQDRNAALEINYAATRMLLEVARGQGVQRFIFASSCSVYGASETVADERSSLNPISLYAQTKCDSETAILAASSGNFHPTVLRFATIFGNAPRPRFDLVVNLLTAKAHQEGVITIFNGDQWRPFLHVDDVARAIHMVLEAPAEVVSGEVFNVGDSRLNHTLSEVAALIGRYFPGTRIEHVENTDRRNYRVNFEKIRTRVGFEAVHRLDDGIAELKAAFDHGAITDYRDVYYHNQRYLQRSGSPQNMDRLDTYVMAAFSQSLAALGRATQDFVPAPNQESITS